MDDRPVKRPAHKCCHRLIGAIASLTGYGGGLERKRWLLAHESARPAARRTCGLVYRCRELYSHSMVPGGLLVTS